MIDRDDYQAESWYAEYLQTDRWKRLSSRCKERDGYVCQFCRKHQQQLTVPLCAHHTTYMYLNAENEQDELDTLITLCKTCHERLHDTLDHPESLYFLLRFNTYREESILSFSSEMSLKR